MNTTVSAKALWLSVGFPTVIQHIRSDRNSNDAVVPWAENYVLASWWWSFRCYTCIGLYTILSTISDAGATLDNLSEEIDTLNKELRGVFSSYLKYFIFRVDFQIQENVKFMTYSEANYYTVENSPYNTDS